MVWPDVTWRTTSTVVSLRAAGTAALVAANQLAGTNTAGEVTPRQRQPLAQEVASPGQPASDRADRPAKLFGRTLVRETFQVAKDDRLAVLLRQPDQLLMKNRVEDQAFRIDTRLSRWPSALSFDFATASRLGPRVRRDPPGNSV